MKSWEKYGIVAVVAIIALLGTASAYIEESINFITFAAGSGLFGALAWVSARKAGEYYEEDRY